MLLKFKVAPFFSVNAENDKKINDKNNNDKLRPAVLGSRKTWIHRCTVFLLHKCFKQEFFLIMICL